ncbi:MAG: hypothetical protein NY202_03415 [Mollicutes bacterium UO1]
MENIGNNNPTSNPTRKEEIKKIKDQITSYAQEILSLTTVIKSLNEKKKEAEEKVKELEQEKTDRQAADDELDTEIKETLEVSAELQAQILEMKNELGLK